MDKFAKIILKILSYIVVVFIVFIIIEVLANGIKYFSLDFFTKYPENGMRQGGIFPAIVGSIYIIITSVIFSVPLGIFTGIFLAEYKDKKISKIVELAVTGLSGMPSIVYGLFGYAMFSIALGFGTSILSASLTLSIMTLPIISNSTKEAMASLPKELKESAYALGAKRNETIFKVLLKASKSRITTGVLLGLGRTLGETAPVLVTGSVFYATSMPKNIFSPVMTLPTHIYYLISAYGKESMWMTSGTAAFLLILILVIYLIAYKIGGISNGNN
ncbi:phosphate ABC transporter, inner membrane subunit PstA [Thermosipho africanus H17ap60334]|jgi:phosphate transport system permease protein|uniref:Phosphate transport system permease protein PstA n=1 Tax=Thermosipho africanus (strain TCF52B) TaxID=484019 RepID=B7IEW6_THEAB|nr:MULTISPECIES: phosphate ABC transporter permease PstA [Thermosipho]ACJ74630.1 phosphate ABC transporter, permease protein PstA [Thermosipho africanus TCF52B]EKF48939.1 phosphate ABC transporter, inner membrane subunit PstA [Thermosipho africanus H17ap60334]RDI92858.1 phosphate ABC transporter permease [Thermosipho africanus Ob7]